MVDILELEAFKTDFPVCFECGFWENPSSVFTFTFRDGEGFFRDDDEKEWMLVFKVVSLKNFLWIQRTEKIKEGAEVYVGKNLGRIFRIYKSDV